MTCRIHWILRLGAAACFIGHGAFGVITKSAWVPYFAVAGFGTDAAYALMPLVGTIDIAMGVAVLLSPRPAVLLYMVAWALWTALLRPLTGEPWFETLERAGNYGVPLALLLLVGWPRGWRGWIRLGDRRPADAAVIARVLRWTTATLLFGHGALAAVTRKPLIAEHWAALGAPGTIAPAVGYVEMAVALLVLAVSSPTLLIGVAVWKLATEALFPISGAPVWEFIERAGSYAAPLALALLLLSRGTAQHSLREDQDDTRTRSARGDRGRELPGQPAQR
ncbi:MAG TPA: hypothetical protein VFZ21_10075 [Gemmatimonadaceae bacterium]|nr:hypothetical protein [Gemmatimonadaceae bacterium]